jgi:spore coat protein U-like protein
MKKKIITLTIIAAFVICGTAMAATDTSDLHVSASVAAACSITGVTDINFGTYDTTSATDTDAAGGITLQCTKDTPYHTYISLTPDMTDGTDSLSYDLYSDAGRTSTFPTDNSGAATNAPDNAAHTTNVYGRIPAGQDVGVGSYTQTLTATVEY